MRGSTREHDVIVWLASYPRSGNTFLRIVLHRLYGVPTYSVYDDDDPTGPGPSWRPKPSRFDEEADDQAAILR